jgi:2C-methyl-D-erythritol 2,4-cyclodiphosphate synthase
MINKAIKYINENIALDISIDQVSIKGKTEEKLGFTGEGLGIAAHASVLIDEI